jgi:hypothetical protein
VAKTTDRVFVLRKTFLGHGSVAVKQRNPGGHVPATLSTAEWRTKEPQIFTYIVMCIGPQLLSSPFLAVYAVP